MNALDLESAGTAPGHRKSYRLVRLARALAGGFVVTCVAYIALTSGKPAAFGSNVPQVAPAVDLPPSSSGLSDGIGEMPGADPLYVDPLATHS